MKILVLDDMQERHDDFTRRWPDHEVFHALKWSEFIDLLKLQKYDMIQLDHDLGNDNESYTDEYGRTRVYDGQDAARKLTMLDAGQRPGLVIVHSVNPVGAQRMVHILREDNYVVKWIPFSPYQSLDDDE